MNDPQVRFEVHRHNAIKEALRKDDPDLDERTLADTVEGLTDLHEILAEIVRGVLKDETMVALAKIRISEMSDRLEAFQTRADTRRRIVKDAMVDASISKIVKEDFTVSVRSGSPHVKVIDEALIPADYIEIRRVVLKGEMLKVMKQGAQIEGAVLSNPGLSLNVRTR